MTTSGEESFIRSDQPDGGLEALLLMQDGFHAILDALEARYPMLRGTVRDHTTQQRRKLVRFFACEEDVTHDSPDEPLPDAIASGAEPFFIIGAIAGG